jgi:hypothetical protein
VTDALLGVLDGVVTAAGRRVSALPVTLRVRPSWDATRKGRVALMNMRVDGVSVGGLRLASVRVGVHDLGVQWVDGLEVVVGATDVSIDIDQHDFDAWSRRLGLPARLVMRDGRIVARFGVAGVRLAQVEMEVKAAGDGLHFSPRRLSSAGVDIRTSTDLAVRIPLPRLLVSPSLTSTDWQDGYGTIRFSLPSLSLPVTRESLRRLGEAMQRLTSESETSGGGQAAVSRNGWARTPRSTGLSGREASPAFST